MEQVLQPMVPLLVGMALIAAAMEAVIRFVRGRALRVALVLAVSGGSVAWLYEYVRAVIAG